MNKRLVKGIQALLSGIVLGSETVFVLWLYRTYGVYSDKWGTVLAEPIELLVLIVSLVISGLISVCLILEALSNE